MVKEEVHHNIRSTLTFEESIHVPFRDEAIQTCDGLSGPRQSLLEVWLVVVFLQ